MTAHGGEPPLLLRPSASPQLAAFILVTHLLALAVALVLPLGWSRWLLVVAIATSALNALLLHVWRSAAKAIIMAQWGGGDRSWLLTLRCGVCCELTLSPATFVGQHLIVLVFHNGWLRSRSLPLFADAVEVGQLRELRRRLRAFAIGRSDTSG